MSSGKKRKSNGFTHKKRHVEGAAERALVEALSNLRLLQEHQQRVLKPGPTEFAFNLALGADEKLRLIDCLWRCDFLPCMGSMLRDNPQLADLLESAVDNRYQPEDEELFMVKRNLKLENVLGILYRTQNQSCMPLFTVLRAIYAQSRCLHRESWDIETALKLLPSRRWTEEVIQLAITRNPGPPFKTAYFVSGAVLDNFTVQVDYKSLHDLDHHGYRLDMTNWGTVSIPLLAVGNGVNIPRIIAGVQCLISGSALHECIIYCMAACRLTMETLECSSVLSTNIQSSHCSTRITRKS
jgi:hypothetical protein